MFLFFTGLLFSISFNLQLRIVICIVINRKLAWWLVFHYLDKVPNADINTCAELPYCSDFLLYSEQYPNSVVLHTQMVSLLLYEYCGWFKKIQLPYKVRYNGHHIWNFLSWQNDPLRQGILVYPSLADHMITTKLGITAWGSHHSLLCMKALTSLIPQSISPQRKSSKLLSAGIHNT